MSLLVRRALRQSLIVSKLYAGPLQKYTYKLVKKWPCGLQNSTFGISLFPIVPCMLIIYRAIYCRAFGAVRASPGGFQSRSSASCLILCAERSPLTCYSSCLLMRLIEHIIHLSLPFSRCFEVACFPTATIAAMIIAHVTPTIAVTGQVVPDDELEGLRLSIFIGSTIAIVAVIIGLGSFWASMGVTLVLGIIALAAGTALSLGSIAIGVVGMIHSRSLEAMRSKPCFFEPPAFWKYMFVGFAGLMAGSIIGGSEAALAIYLLVEGEALYLGVAIVSLIACLLFGLAGLIAFLKCERLQTLLIQGGSLEPVPVSAATTAPHVVAVGDTYTYPPQIVQQQPYIYQVGVGAPTYPPHCPQQW
jgi:hypothetical protein